MKGNDLANRVVPRFVLVWEGLLGILPDIRVAAEEEKFRRKRKWDQAVGCYEINEMLARKIWDQVVRHGLEIDLLTYKGKEFAKALEGRVEREDLPMREVFSEDPKVFARSLIYRPNISVVYDPDPAHQFLYGGKGETLLPDQYNRFGVK